MKVFEKSGCLEKDSGLPSPPLQYLALFVLNFPKQECKFIVNLKECLLMLNCCYNTNVVSAGLF